MPKRYPQWLDNSVAIELRSLAEKQDFISKEIYDLRQEEDGLQRLLDDVRQDIKTKQIEFQGVTFAITNILRQNVPRFIQAGNIISFEDKRR